MCSLAIVPHFVGLCRFSQGRRFKQWTGDDSKVLMKVFVHDLYFFIEELM